MFTPGPQYVVLSYLGKRIFDLSRLPDAAQPEIDEESDGCTSTESTGSEKVSDSTVCPQMTTTIGSESVSTKNLAIGIEVEEGSNQSAEQLAGTHDLPKGAEADAAAEETRVDALQEAKSEDEKALISRMDSLKTSATFPPEIGQGAE